METKSLLLVWCIILFCTSCTNTNYESENVLRLRNRLLMNKIDSLSKIIRTEQYSVVTFDNGFNESNKKEFLVALTISNESLVKKISYGVFSNKDSLKMAFENINLFQKSVETNNFDGLAVCQINRYYKGINYFGGVLSINRNGENQNFPFKYKFNSERNLTP